MTPVGRRPWPPRARQQAMFAITRTPPGQPPGRILVQVDHAGQPVREIARLVQGDIPDDVFAAHVAVIAAAPVLEAELAAIGEEIHNALMHRQPFVRCTVSRCARVNDILAAAAAPQEEN